MNWKTLVGLGIVFFALAGFVYYYEFKDVDRRQAAEQDKGKLYKFEASDVQEIWIEGARRVHLRKQSDQWKLVEPVDGPADPTSVDAIATALADARSTREFAADSSHLKEFSLQEPAWKVRFALKDKSQHEIWLGAKDFSGSNLYSRQKSGSDIHLISDAVLTAVDKEVTQFRNRQLVVFDSSKVERIAITEAAKTLEVSRSGADQWTIEKPAPLPADGGEISSLLSGLSAAQIKEFISEKPEDLESFGLDAPARKIELFLGKEGTRVLEVGSAVADGFYVRVSGSPQILTVVKDSLSKIVADPTVFRDKSVASWKSEEAESFKFKNAQGSLWLEKSGAFAWKFKEPAALKDKEVQYYRVITPFETLRAAEIVDTPGPLKGYGLEPASIEVEVVLKGKPPVKIWIGKDAKEKIWARSSQSAAVYRLDSDLVAQLTFKPEEVVQK